MTGRQTGAVTGAPWPGEAWRSRRFLQLFVFTLLALLLVPLQLRFRAPGFVLTALYLNAVAVSLSMGRHRMLRWVFLAMGIVALGHWIDASGDGEGKADGEK